MTTRNRTFWLMSLGCSIAFGFLFFLTTQAATITNLDVQMSSNYSNTSSDYTFAFDTPSGVLAGETIEIHFTDGYDLTAIDYTDMDLADDGVDVTLGPVAVGGVWGVAVVGQGIVFTSGTGTIAGGSTVTIEIGLNATAGVAGDAQIVNPPASSPYITIDGTFADEGSLIFVIKDNPTMTVVAQVGSGGPPPTCPPLVISNVQVINLTTTSATITWDTNDLATTIVEYGLTTTYELGSPGKFEFELFHSITLNNLTPDTTYHFRVISRNNCGNQLASGDFTFTTPEIEGVYLTIKTLPEKRLPPQGNWSNEFRIKIYETGTMNVLLDQLASAGDNGTDTSVSLEMLTFPATVDVMVKGMSHLGWRENNIVLTGNSDYLDFSYNETLFIKAGDVNAGSPDGDNYVNGIDLSVLSNDIYNSTLRNDLNRDGFINGLEFGIAVTNLYSWGDF